MTVAAPACTAALNQATVRWPGRSRASDGILGDPRHQARVSDHNQGNAFDLTHDPKHGVDCDVLAVQLVDLAKTGRERRLKYVIWNRRIASEEHGWRWRPYDGSNPHTKHMHVSIKARHRDDTSPWWDRDTPAEEDPLTADDRKWLESQFKALASRVQAVEDRVDTHAVTILRGPSHPSLTRIRDLLGKIADKVGAEQ